MGSTFDVDVIDGDGIVSAKLFGTISDPKTSLVNIQKVCYHNK